MVTIEEAIFAAMEADKAEGRVTPLSWVYRSVEARVRDELTRLVDEGKIEYIPGFSPVVKYVEEQDTLDNSDSER